MSFKVSSTCFCGSKKTRNVLENRLRRRRGGGSQQLLLPGKVGEGHTRTLSVLKRSFSSLPLFLFFSYFPPRKKRSPPSAGRRGFFVQLALDQPVGLQTRPVPHITCCPLRPSFTHHVLFVIYSRCH